MNFQEKVKIEDELEYYFSLLERAKAINSNSKTVTEMRVYCEKQVKNCLEKLNAE